MMGARSLFMSRTKAESTRPNERRYGGLSPDERRAARRERLLTAAFDAFGTRGFATTTIEGICADAGVTARHFYEDFDSRESLLRAAADRVVDRVNDAIREAVMADSASLEARVENGVRAFLDSMLGDPRNARILCVECVGVSPAFEIRRREVLRGFATTVAAAVELVRPTLASDDPRVRTASMIIVGGANEVVVDWLQSEDRLDVESMARDFVSLFSAMIQGIPA